tara:strand:+ start:39 stop:287 length:249 start_codon:yes stop_codon:yes gene_type:complete
MGRVKDLLYTGVYDMSYEDDLLRENNILRKNVKDLQEQLNKSHQRIKHLTSNEWSNKTPDHSSLQEVVDPKQMDLKLDDRRD